MVLGGIAEVVLGVTAERRSLEDVATPLSAGTSWMTLSRVASAGSGSGGSAVRAVRRSGQCCRVGRVARVGLGGPFCVLALIREGETYGSEIANRLGSLQLLESQGTLYPLLARLRREEVVTSSLRESERGAARRYYRPTPQGGREFTLFVDRWELFNKSVAAVLKGGSR